MKFSNKKKYWLLAVMLTVFFILFLLFYSLYLKNVAIYEPVTIKINELSLQQSEAVEINSITPLDRKIPFPFFEERIHWACNYGFHKSIELVVPDSIIPSIDNVTIVIKETRHNIALKDFKPLKIPGGKTKYIILDNICAEKSFFKMLFSLFYWREAIIFLKILISVIIISLILFFKNKLITLISLLYKKIKALTKKNNALLKQLSGLLMGALNTLKNIIILILRNLSAFLDHSKTQHFIRITNISIIIFIILWGYSWLILASFYSYPNVEDISVVIQLNDVRYFSDILYKLSPLAWGGVFVYKYTPVISLLLITFSLYLFINSIFRNSVRKIYALLTASFIVVFHFLSIPSIVQDLYWMASSFVYLYSWIFYFLWVGLFIRLLHSKKTRTQFFYFITSAFALICDYGLSEMMIFFNTISLLFFTLFINKFIPGKKHYIYSIFILGIACTLVRLTFFSFDIDNDYFYPDINRDFGFFKHTFSVMSKQFINLLYGWSIQNMMTIPLIFGFAILIGKINKKSCLFKLKKNHLIIFLILLLIFVFVLPYFWYYFKGTEEYPERFSNFIHWLFLLIVFFVSPLLLIKLNVFLKLNIQKYHLPILSCILIFTLCQIFFTKNNLFLIKKEYDQGIYSEYKNEMNIRFNDIRKIKNLNGWKCVELKPLEVLPKTIFHPPDIEPNRNYPYWNWVYESYFGIDEVKIKGDTIKKLDNILKDASK